MLVVRIKCPACSKSYSVNGSFMGRKARCRQCGLTFTITPASLGDHTGAGSASAAAAVHATGPSLAPPSLVSLAGMSASEAPSPAVGSQAELPEQFGRYRILRTLGRGGMGAVYLAHDTQLDRQVALKVPHFTPGEGPEAIARFHREARAAATLDHPNLCPVYDVGQIDGIHYLTMPYIEGKPLSAFINRDQPTPMRQAAAVVRNLALTLQAAHDRGIIHRDLKPANIIANRRRELVVMDFGLARRSDLGDSRLTKSGALLGTPLYMAPEQVRGDHDSIGPASDIYSLGVILYELLAGRRPFDGPVSLVLAWILVAEPPRLPEHRPDLDPVLDAICRKAMAKQPEDRYATMAEFAAALGAYISAGPTRPDTEPADGPVDSDPRRNAPSPPAGAETLADQFVQRLVIEGAVINLDSRALPLKAAPAASPSRPPRRRGPVLALAAGAASLVMLGVLVFVVTGEGTIRIEVDAPGVEVEIDGEAVAIRGLGEPITIRTGEHKLIVKQGDKEVHSKTFMVTRGPNPTLKVELMPQLLGRPAVREAPPWLESVAGREAEPDETERGRAERQLLDDFEKRLAEGKLEVREKLSQELLDSAKTPVFQSKARYARLRLAGRIAAEDGAFTTAMNACKELERWFDVDAIKLKTHLLEKHARFADSPQKLEQLAIASIGTGFEAIGLEDYRFAEPLVRLATSTAKKASIVALIDQAGFLAEEMEAGRRGYVAVRGHVETLRQKPSDAGSNAEVGRFLCLVKNDWQRGLPMLAKGNNTELRSLAEKEIGLPTKGLEMLAIGDSWWDLAERGDVLAPRVRLRARYWYLKALALKEKTLDVATVERVRRRLNRIPAREFQVRVLARSADFHTVRLSGDGIASTSHYGYWPKFSINHIQWTPDSVKSYSNAGASRLLPDDVDFTTAEIRDLKVVGGEWGDYHRTRLYTQEDQAELLFSHEPSAAVDVEFTLWFGRSASAKDLSINPEWSVKYYQWEQAKYDDADYWRTLYQGEPLAQAKVGRIDFFNWQGSWHPGVPGDYFVMVATAEVELPAGDLKVTSWAEDEVRVWLDGNIIIDRWRQGAGAAGHREEVLVNVKGGKHSMKVEYREHRDGTFLFATMKIL